MTRVSGVKCATGTGRIFIPKMLIHSDKQGKKKNEKEKRKKKKLDINVVDLLYFGQDSGSFLKK